MSNLEQLLIGRKISWVETEYDDEDRNFYYAHRFSGTILFITQNRAVTQLDDGSRKPIDLYDLTQWISHEPDFLKIRNAVFRHFGNLRREARLADRTPHTVYALVDLQEVTQGWNPATTLPEPQAVHYVGLSQNVELRFQQHLYCSGNNVQKIDWIQGLQARGLQPWLSPLEEVKGRYFGLQREVYWTKYYLSHNAPLTNGEVLWLSNI